MDTRSTRARALLAGVAVVGLLVAGCSGDDAGAGSEAVDATAPEMVDDGGADVGGGGDTARDESGAEGGDPGAEDAEALAGRALVFRVTLTLSSDDPDTTAQEVRARAVEAGGFVSDTRLQRDDLGLLSGTITIRVPSEQLDALLAEVSETAASVVSEERTTEDVTGQLTDIEARLRNLRALEEELLVVLTEAREAGDTEDVLDVFDRITQVRGEIETIDARRAALEELVALSTVTVNVQPSRALVTQAQSVPEQDRPLPWNPGNEAAGAWDRTVAALQQFVDGIIWVAVYGLPVALVWLSPLVLLALAARWWQRRRRGGAPPATPSRAAPVPPPVPPGQESTAGDRAGTEVAPPTTNGPGASDDVDEEEDTPVPADATPKS